MHEVGIMQQALEAAEDAARAQGAERITKLRLRIGALAGVVPDALAFAFEVVAKGTLAESAEFGWDEVPVLCRCGAGCGDFAPQGPIYACPVCQTVSWDVLQGRELELAEVEIEMAQ